MLYLSHYLTYQLLFLYIMVSSFVALYIFVCMHVSLHVYELLMCFICSIMVCLIFLFLCFPERKNEGLELDLCGGKDMHIKVQRTYRTNRLDHKRKFP